MAKPIIVEGQTATNPDTKQQIVYRSGKWFPVGEEPATAGATKSIGPEARVRFGIGMGPAIEAQKNLFEAEKWNQNQQNRLGSNPYDTLSGQISTSLAPESSAESPMRARLSQGIGGQRFQDYTQAAKSFESAFMPILSGAAVSASEAQRLISASLPEPGNSPETLAKKARNRAMMINGAAALMGEPPPFPRVPTMSFGGSGGKPTQSAQPAPAGGRPSLDQIFGN